MSERLSMAHEALHVLHSVAPPLASRHLRPAPRAGCSFRCIRFNSHSPCTPIWASPLLTPMPPVGAGVGGPPSHSRLFPCLYLLLGLSSVRTRGLVCLVGLWS